MDLNIQFYWLLPTFYQSIDFCCSSRCIGFIQFIHFVGMWLGLFWMLCIVLYSLRYHPCHPSSRWSSNASSGCLRNVSEVPSCRVPKWSSATRSVVPFVPDFREEVQLTFLCSSDIPAAYGCLMFTKTVTCRVDLNSNDLDKEIASLIQQILGLLRQIFGK